MTVDLTKQAEDLLKAARETRIPDNVRAFAEDGVATTRKAYDALQSATREHAHHTASVLTTVQSGGKTLADKLLANSAANAEATFAATLKIVRAPTLSEAGRLQAEFVQSQLVTANAQTQ
jgi:hypothetical protein